MLAEQHGTEALVSSNHPREAAASTCLAVIFDMSVRIECADRGPARYQRPQQRIYSTLDPPFNSSANAGPVSVQAVSVQCHYSEGTDVGRCSLETTGNRVFDIMSLVGVNGVTLSYCYFGDYSNRG